MCCVHGAVCLVILWPCEWTSALPAQSVCVEAFPLCLHVSFHSRVFVRDGAASDHDSNPGWQCVCVFWCVRRTHAPLFISDRDVTSRHRARERPHPQHHLSWMSDCSWGGLDAQCLTSWRSQWIPKNTAVCADAELISLYTPQICTKHVKWL